MSSHILLLIFAHTYCSTDDHLEPTVSTTHVMFWKNVMTRYKTFECQLCKFRKLMGHAAVFQLGSLVF